MCGIAGYVGFDDERMLRRMCRALQHRGPDAEGFYAAPGVGLAHRRLSIIDLINGRQPMTNEDGTLQLVFNGEIYNYEKLTADLKAKGHVFKTASDTETILHAYEEYGLDCVQHMRGMFAFALWDSKKKKLVMARDRIGEKPLYYAAIGNKLAFGSEIKAVLPCLPTRSVDARAVCEFLAAGYVPAPRTFFAEVRKLPPGYLLVHENGKVTVSQYWSRDKSASGASFEEASDELVRLLRESATLCLKSDVEVGAFLSGGLDSSLITALMREVNTKVQTFCVGYRGAAAGFNELEYAKFVSQTVGSNHHELILDAKSSMELLPKILWHYDEPHGEPTSVLVYLLCEFTRKHVTVSLGGTGGDELFHGYPRDKAVRWLGYYNLVPSAVRKHLIERTISRFPESTRGSRLGKRVKRFVQGASDSPSETYLNWVSLLNRGLRQDLVSAAVRGDSEDAAGDQFMREFLTADDQRDLYAHATDLSVGGYLPEYQLCYMDRMSMAHGLEVRSPLCDYRLVEFATRLPAHYRLKGSESKHILKSVSGRWLPQQIIHRKKVGFDSPIGQWFKDELKDFLTRFLSKEQVRRSGLLNPDAVQRMIGDHVSGVKDYSLQLWSVIALEAWYRMYIEEDVLATGDLSLENLRGASAQQRGSGLNPGPSAPVEVVARPSETTAV
ncbi:MAG TPA: asparagine synthase (glutamine-hydrolyzing) [Candidatus Angelobacter sp.]|nr:asparagine synthase (glutamine-hydrolyzing) [Candidatus Angelobacter sp.]